MRCLTDTGRSTVHGRSFGQCYDLFFKLCVLPELIGKYFSKPFDSLPAAASSSNASVCTCQGTGDGELVECANAACKMNYHLKCLKLKTKPKHKWHCPVCRRQRSAAKKK